MPNPTDYDENGNLIDPEYWDGPPDYRSTKQRIDDYFSGDRGGFFHKFDWYEDWLYYPPKIETKDEADDIVSKKISKAKKKIVDAFPEEDKGKLFEYISGAMKKYDIVKRYRMLVYRFCKEMHPAGWTRYKERNKILEEMGKKVKNDTTEKKEYIIEFGAVVTYKAKVRTTMDIDDLFEYYCDDSGSLNMDHKKLAEMIKDGSAKPYSDGGIHIEDESLSVMRVKDDNHIIDSRMY